MRVSPSAVFGIRVLVATGEENAMATRKEEKEKDGRRFVRCVRIENRSSATLSFVAGAYLLIH